MTLTTEVAEVLTELNQDFDMPNAYLKPSNVNDVFHGVSRGRLSAVPIDRTGQKVSIVESSSGTLSQGESLEGIHHSYAVLLDHQQIGEVFFTGNYLYRENSEGVVALVEDVLRHVGNQDTRAQFYQGIKCREGYEVSRVGKSSSQSEEENASPKKAHTKGRPDHTSNPHFWKYTAN